MTQTILVTGSEGFIGKHVSERLVKDGYKVRYLDRKNGTWIQNITPQSLSGIGTVIHLANDARIGPSWQIPSKYYTNNISYTTEFFRICQLAGVKKFIYASSSSVYGDNGFYVQREDQVLNPTNPYALSKMAAELSLKMFAKETELIIVRPFTIYGKGMPLTGNALVIGHYIQHTLDGKPLPIEGDGLQKRDFLHIDDCVEGMLLLLRKGSKGCYNLGSGVNTSILKLADLFGGEVEHKPKRPGPEYNTCASIAKLEQLGFSPKTQLEDWIELQKTNNFEDFKCP